MTGKYSDMNRYDFKLNKFSYFLVQTMKWPKEMCLIFKTEREASLCMKTIFPDHKSQQLKIRVEVKPFDFERINWNNRLKSEDLPSVPKFKKIKGNIYLLG